jgi:hypothetical protein
VLIQVIETHPPKAGGKVGTVVTADGSWLECWPEKLAGSRLGAGTR